MCGITGFNGHFSPQNLIQANHLQSHRGPDDSGTYFDQDQNIGLAHTRLSILELSPLGHQPMLSYDGLVAFVFNGETCNFRELKSRLESKGHAFKGTSDSEVLLRLYLEQGQEMLAGLNGISFFVVNR
jgi:asparagine synthase (glutamine-hydrolysing)